MLPIHRMRRISKGRAGSESDPFLQEQDSPQSNWCAIIKAIKTVYTQIRKQGQLSYNAYFDPKKVHIGLENAYFLS